MGVFFLQRWNFFHSDCVSLLAVICYKNQDMQTLSCPDKTIEGPLWEIITRQETAEIGGNYALLSNDNDS